MKIESYLKLVQEAYEQTKSYWRYGQTLFNVLDVFDKDIANKFRGSKFDPFYTTDNAKIALFLEQLKKEFDNNET